jgi:repressor LexA
VTRFSLTDRQRGVLAFITARLAAGGEAPSYEEIAAGCGLGSRGQVAAIVAALVERGHLVQLPHKKRSLALPAVASLPPGLRARLAAYCAARGESDADVIADAIALHLDIVEGFEPDAARPGGEPCSA